MTVDTRTTERIESTVETVEIEEVQCPICEQWYEDDDELVAVAVGATYEPDGEVVTAAHNTQVCTGCTASLFAVEPEPGRIDRVRAALSRPLIDLGDVSLPTQVIKPLVSLGITLSVAGIVTSVGLNVANDVAAQVEPSDVEQVGAPLGFLDLLPTLLLVMIAWAVLKMPRMGGFR